MKRILLARYLLPRRQDALADHTYASPSPLLHLSVPALTDASYHYRAFPASDLDVDAAEVVIPPDDGCRAHTQTPAINNRRGASKKRKRRRRNEYDFGPKRKRAKKKEVNIPTKDDSFKDGTQQLVTSIDPPDINKNMTFDPDSLNAVKDLYGHSEAKRYQNDLFGDEKLAKVNASVTFTPQTATSQAVPSLLSHVSSQNFKQSGVDDACNPNAERCLKQTTCCQFYKSRRKPSQNEGRTYRRRHGLWMKGDRCSQRLVVKNKKLPFHELPTHCKFYIFSLLDPASRGLAAQVCHDWREWVMDPDSWRHLNLDFLSSGLSYQQVKDAKRKSVARTRYDFFKARTANFAAYLSHFTPRPESLSFSFDIGNQQDNWFSFIEALINDSDLRKLSVVDIDWQTTPAKPATLETYCCIFNKARVLFKMHFTRLRVFHRMLDMLTKRAKHVQHLSLPFDWSPRSVLLLSRWSALTSVRLFPYLNVLGVSQDVLHACLRSLQSLEHLQLAICVPLFTNTTLYSLSHQTLQTLDLSECQGFFLKHIDLPRLQDLRLNENTWQGALVSEAHASVPCVHEVLRRGAPGLEVLNRFNLAAFWTDFIYDELEVVLNKVCSCQKHFPQAIAAGGNN